MREVEIIRHEKSGLWWPNDTNPDAGFEYMIKRVTDIDVALRYVRKTAVAVQAGGNIGMWPLRLAKSFSLVHTFEPVAHIFRALHANTKSVPGIVAHAGLLSAPGVESVPFTVHPGGTSRVDMQATEMFPTTTIDALKLPCCDAIFLDVEGHELVALEGAKQTIDQFKPVITLEAWDTNVEHYKQVMDKLGYEFVTKVHMDMIFRPR